MLRTKKQEVLYCEIGGNKTQRIPAGRREGCGGGAVMLIFFKNHLLCTRHTGKLSPADVDFLNTAAGVTTHSTPGGDGDVTKKGPGDG